MVVEISSFYIVSLIIVCGYAGILAWFTRGWYRLEMCELKAEHPSTTVTIIVPARNEESFIRQCLEGLIAQDFPGQLFEIIVVDDHSNDSTLQIVRDIAQFTDRIKLRVYSLSEAEGKKAAIKLAMKFATGTLVLCTDADCSHPKGWVSAMVKCFELESPVFISAPVLLKSNGRFFGLFQELEFMSLIASGAGAIGSGTPVMCNGANLGFSSKAYKNLRDDAMKADLSSGDDVFLMLSMKKAFGSSKIAFAKNKDAIVIAQAARTMSGLVKQRLRWVSKSHAYRDAFLIFTALSVMSMNSVIVVAFVAGFFSPGYFWLFSGILLLKILLDFPLLVSFARFAGEQKKAWLIPLIQPLVVLFTTFSAIAGNLVKVSWKGRKNS